MCIRWIAIQTRHHKHINWLPWKYSKFATGKFSKISLAKWGQKIIIITTSNAAGYLSYSLYHWVFISDSIMLYLIDWRSHMTKHHSSAPQPWPCHCQWETTQTTTIFLKNPLRPLTEAYSSFYIIIILSPVSDMDPREKIHHEFSGLRMKNKNILCFICITLKENLHLSIKRNEAGYREANS